MKCKVCKHKLEKDENGLYCNNPNCPVRFADINKISEEDIKKFSGECNDKNKIAEV